MISRETAARWLLVLVLAAIFIATVERLKLQPRQTVSVEIQVALPLFVQVLMGLGDRNLAADFATIRALVVVTEKMRPEEYKVLGKVQSDASWLNPAHEDNYYIAAHILPWAGEYEAAQTVLARATHARFFDYQPAFLYAFNLMHFKGDHVGAAEWLRAAALKMPEDDENRLIMQNLAARWMDKAPNIDMAISVVEAMAKQAKRKDFRAYLEMRVERLRSLKSMRVAAAVFLERHGRVPARLDELVGPDLLPSIPRDPIGFGFDLDKQGQVVLRTSPPKS
ncbi:MAG: hypothetical protein HZA63_06975 [Rhodocyclales bacterium]|nr:hypothetical protein [Rhodocyclales bacterium]